MTASVHYASIVSLNPVINNKNLVDIVFVSSLIFEISNNVSS